MQQFSSVKYLNEFPNGNNSPAMVNRKTGELYINLNRWNDIAFEHRVFILLHELGHCVLNSSDEKAVDEWAHKKYIEMGYSLTESVYALTRVLHANSKINYERSMAQYKRAKEIEDRHNRLSSFDGYDAIKNDPNCYITGVDESFDGQSIIVHYEETEGFDVNGEVDSLPGLSRKQYRKKKRAARLYKRIGRGKKKNAVANDIQAGADTRMVYAKQGMYVPTRAESVGGAVSKSIQAVAGAIGGAFGGGGMAAGVEDQVKGLIPGQQYGNDAEQTPPIVAQAPKSRLANPAIKSDTPTASSSKKYIVFGAVGLLAVVGLFVFIPKK